jgi:hypothetical protein
MTYESEWTGLDALPQSGLHEALNAAGVDCNVHGYCDRAAQDWDPSQDCAATCDQSCRCSAGA